MATDKARLIDFPIFPHLKKFIYSFYDYPTSEPIEINMRMSLGIAMKHVLREKKKANLKNLERYEERIQLLIGGEFLDLELRPAYIVNFNMHYDRMFKEFMYTWIKAQELSGINNRQSIQAFLQRFNIKENEYSYDAAQRQWLRFKNKEYEFHPEIRPNLPRNQS